MGKKEEILSEAFALFCQKGYHLSVSDIAKKVSIKPPSLYSHFQSKDEIIEKIVKAEIEDYFSTMVAKFRSLEDSNLSYKERFEAVFWSILDYYNNIQHLRFWHNISLIDQSTLREQCKNMIRSSETEYKKLFVDLFQKAALHKEIKDTFHEGHIFLMITMIQGLLNALFMYDTLMNLHDTAKKTFDAYWDSIKLEGND